MPLGKRHLRRVLSEFLAHDHAERHHQGLTGQLIEPSPDPLGGKGRVVCRERLGGMLRFYHREAA